MHLAVGLLAVMLTSCLNNQQKTSAVGSSGANSIVSKGTVVGNVGSTNELQCLIFQNNANDYRTCIACKKTMCNCVISGACTDAEVAACTLNESLLAQCVHDNVSASGGICLGLTCGTNQVADFSSCLCRDASPPTSIGAQPGQEDTLTPYLEPGMSLVNRYCLPGDPATKKVNGVDTVQQDVSCLYFNSGLGAAQAPVRAQREPIYETSPPKNVHQDLGYIRWDLALDASQFGPAAQLKNKLAHQYSNATIPATLSMYYQLKPTTQLASSVANWQDCVEHFSGYSSGGTNFASSNVQCDTRTAGTQDATPALSVSLTAASAYSGTAKVENVSLNGTVSNTNLLIHTATGNRPLNVSSGVASSARGLAKRDNSVGVNTGAGTPANGYGVGMLSNIGYYKYSWGPVTVRRTTDSTTAQASVTGRIALNTNLGYTPASAVESTAMSQNSATNTALTRDCTTTQTPHPCVVTAVYRGSGGSVLAQSFGPEYASRNHASSVSSLPSGVVAVSTPKVVEDVSQEAPEITKPARLRTFVRGSDGNIYMSRYEAGSWNSWMSLGRPWICKSGSTGCDTAAAGPRIYRPVTYTTMAGVDTISPNDGISIASEPVVVTWVDKGTAAGQPTKQVIVILVRVSHFLSSTGAEPTTAGVINYHNSVFYTMAVADVSKTSSTWLFDNVSAWTQWAPVSTSGAFKVQGNPVGILKASGGTSGANLTLFVLGTNARDGANNMLHPPIAPKSSEGYRAVHEINNADMTFRADFPTTGYWYNYGTQLIGTSINVSTATSSNVMAATAPNWYSIMPNWTATQTFNSYDASMPGYISDWNYMPVNMGAGITNSLTVRMLGNQIVPKICGSGTAVGPCEYDHQVDWLELTLVPGNAAPFSVACGVDAMNNNVGAGTRVGAYTRMNFLGAPHGINLSSVSRSANANLASTLNGTALIYGRAVCPDATKCDAANPGMSYAAVNSLSHCSGAEVGSPAQHSQYYYGGNTTQASAAATIDGTKYGIQPFPVTSDAIPIFSNSWNNSPNLNDVPIYVLVRDINGKMATGIWAGSNDTSVSGTGQGFPYLNFFFTGAFTN